MFTQWARHGAGIRYLTTSRVCLGKGTDLLPLRISTAKSDTGWIYYYEPKRCPKGKNLWPVVLMMVMTRGRRRRRRRRIKN
jgi:hypothetical protein